MPVFRRLRCLVPAGRAGQIEVHCRVGGDTVVREQLGTSDLAKDANELAAAGFRADLFEVDFGYLEAVGVGDDRSDDAQAENDGLTTGASFRCAGVAGLDFIRHVRPLYRRSL